MRKLRQLEPRRKAVFFALFLGVFLFCWSFWINDNSFGTSGSPTNPQTGVDSSIQYTVSGSFSSTSSAGGQVNASQNGGSCIIANWSASR